VWPGAVFNDEFTAWVLDGERPCGDARLTMSVATRQQYPSRPLNALRLIVERHNFRDRTCIPQRVGYFVTMHTDTIVDAALRGLREERREATVGRCPRCMSKRVHQCLSGGDGCMHCDDCPYTWMDAASQCSQIDTLRDLFADDAREEAEWEASVS
jgi:hypothetical protein